MIPGTHCRKRKLTPRSQSLALTCVPWPTQSRMCTPNYDYKTVCNALKSVPMACDTWPSKSWRGRKVCRLTLSAGPCSPSLRDTAAAAALTALEIEAQDLSGLHLACMYWICRVCFFSVCMVGCAHECTWRVESTCGVSWSVLFWGELLPSV